MHMIHIEEFLKRGPDDIGRYSAQFSRNRQRNRINRLPCDGVDCPRCPVSYSCAASRAGLRASVLPWPGMTLLILAAAALMMRLA